MALSWVNVFDLPGVSIYNNGSSYMPVTFSGKTFVVEDYSSKGFQSDVCTTPTGGAHAGIWLPNSPDVAGWTFTGRQRVVVLESVVDGPGGPWADRVHMRQNTDYYPSGGVAFPETTYVMDPSSGDPRDAFCIAGLTLDGAGGTAAYFFTGAGCEPGWGTIRYQWTLEFEVDSTPTPPTPTTFWQDFIGCKEIVE